MLWAKTVAPFGVPFYPSAAGPSGTSSPIFHVLDAFFGRATYRTRLGREMTHLNQWHPRHWRDFVDAVRRTSVRSYVEARGHPPLRVAYDDALARLCRRVRVPRSAPDEGLRLSGTGLQGRPDRDDRRLLRTVPDPHLDEVDTELARAADERRAGPRCPRPPAATPASVHSGCPAGAPVRRRAAQQRPRGYWIAVDGVVYDVTALRRIHPGGVDILDAHAGTDATAAFHRVGHHGSRPGERARRAVPDRGARSGAAPDRPTGAVPVLDRRDLPRGRDGERAAHRPRAAPPEASVTPLGLRHRSEIHERFRSTYLDAVTDEIADGLWRRTLADVPADRRPGVDAHQLDRIRHSHDHRADAVAADALPPTSGRVAAAAGPAGTLMAQRLEARIRRLERIDTALLADVKQLLMAGARMMERDGVGHDIDLAAALRGLPPVVARYRGRVAAVLRTAG